MTQITIVQEPTPGTWLVGEDPTATVWLYPSGLWRCSEDSGRCPHTGAVQLAAVSRCHCGAIACDTVRGVPLCPGHCHT